MFCGQQRWGSIVLFNEYHHTIESGVGMMILVTGRTERKSRHAEALIGDSSQVLYIATSQILDDEMAARIEHHRQKPSGALAHGGALATS